MKYLKSLLYTGILFLILSSLLSCSSEKKDNTNTPVSQPDAVLADTSVMPLNAAPVEQMPADPAMTNTQTATPAGKNPPHGEPGHRCDIEVGAPLDSKPMTNPGAAANIQTAPAQTSNPGINMSAPQTAAPSMSPPPTVSAPPAGKTAPGMNPPHGEPGHDCGIAVGAPLKK
jgi:hypothetical protein